MTRENREREYKHYRWLSENYEPAENMDSGLTSKSRVRAIAKERADAMLKKDKEREIIKQSLEAMNLHEISEPVGDAPQEPEEEAAPQEPEEEPLPEEVPEV